jgi:hypothetical protein
VPARGHPGREAALAKAREAKLRRLLREAAAKRDRRKLDEVPTPPNGLSGPAKGRWWRDYYRRQADEEPG